MDIFTVLVVIICTGVILYCINVFLPMDSKIKMILNVVVVSVLIFWILKVFGIIAYLKHLHV